MADAQKLLLVGDNPFHGLSHLSQERARARGGDPTNPDYAARLVLTCVENGANGFFFSGSESTLAVLRSLRSQKPDLRLDLFGIVPYAYEYVRAAVLLGGAPGLARKLARDMVVTRNIKAILKGVQGVVFNDPGALLAAYVSYEVSRLRSSIGKEMKLRSVLIHEVVTDMALGLSMDWLFRAHMKEMWDRGMAPGFDTRNFPFLVRKFKSWGLNLDGVVVTAPFNAAGYQMCPSREACEQALAEATGADVIAYSLLAAGYLKPSEAFQYAKGLPNLKGLAVGVSKPEQATNTFKLLRETFA